MRYERPTTDTSIPRHIEKGGVAGRGNVCIHTEREKGIVLTHRRSTHIPIGPCCVCVIAGGRSFPLSFTHTHTHTLSLSLSLFLSRWPRATL
jgi:hypothetical protein